MPEQPILYSSSLSDQVFAVVDKEFDFALPAFKLGHREMRFTQRGTRHRERVYGVRLAELATASAHTTHQLRRDLNHHLTSAQQLTFQQPRQMSAVLQRPLPLRPLTGPIQRLQVAARGRRHPAFSQLTSVLVDHDQGVRALVAVAAKCHHVPVSFSWGYRTGRRTRLSGGGST